MAKKKSKKQPSKITFFEKKRKTYIDKFYDIYESSISYTPNKKDKDGNVLDWKRHGIIDLSKKLKISPKTIDKYYRTGKVNENLYYLTRNIDIQHKKLKIPRIKTVTKEFTKHNFTRINFFKKKKIKKNKNYQYLFRAGIHLEFSRERRLGVLSGQWHKKEKKYVINNYAVTHYKADYDKGFDEFFKEIEDFLESKPSLVKFIFNYCDVSIVDMSSIPPNQIVKTIHKK